MKKLLAATVIATTATCATAGSYSDPIIEPIVIVEDTSSSGTHGWMVPVMFLLILVAANY